MVKKAEETPEKEITEKESVKEDVKETPKVEFRTAKYKNFVGFVHPSTRKLVSVDKEGKLFVDETDKKALEILRNATDVVEI